MNICIEILLVVSISFFCLLCEQRVRGCLQIEFNLNDKHVIKVSSASYSSAKIVSVLKTSVDSN
ncbi:hypothetical protein GCM10010969_20210 [Saccharibacillus kuerlensis]|uniref:Secreted protein n=1 Tax=Saccharibacillus kuerlensis TaxID=459527 RepID=A0ABQ2L1N2_9BACL|nr:hypothetical protein GCM10010969_20210 [Saccharibacillus kuerlensis]